MSDEMGFSVGIWRGHSPGEFYVQGNEVWRCENIQQAPQHADRQSMGPVLS